jgi:hypothetical protein
MNGKSPKILTTPPFVLRFSKDERGVFQQNQMLCTLPGIVARSYSRIDQNTDLHNSR